jgi:SET domain-containing protein 6
MGSRILSRSFQVEKWDPSANDEEADGGPQAEMDVDVGHPDPAEPNEGYNDDAEEEHVGDSDDDDDDSSDVAMVPMADMLNARFGCNNVCYVASVFAHIRFTVLRHGYSTKNWNLKW